MSSPPAAPDPATRLRRQGRRLSVRVKVTLAFTAVMAVVLAALGLFLGLRMKSDLDRSIDQGLRARAADVAALVKQADEGFAQAGRSALAVRGEGFAQLIDARGAVVDATPTVARTALLDGSVLRRARRGAVRVERTETGPAEASRLLALPVTGADGQRIVAVLGTPLESRDTALQELAALMLIGFPAALGLAALAGYGATTAALRPVEVMRRRAAGISAGAPGRRLPVPAAQDEVHRLGVTLNAMLARLEDALARERGFVADASHELRTPLAILKAELELALRPQRTPRELRRAVASAADETDRLARLAEDLLVVARSDEGRLPVRRTSVDVDELVQTVARRFEARAVTAGRRLAWRDGTALVVTADVLRLEQALGNLVDNALRHGAGEVEVEARRDDGSVELHVRDRGPGFPDAFRAKAFERFTRADPARGRGGSGLGLAIVAAIATAHGGGAHVANRARGGGADAWISVPARPADPTGG